MFDNKSSSVNEDPTINTGNKPDDTESGAAFLIRILRYLETPQYLRKALFPKLNSLRFVVRDQLIDQLVFSFASEFYLVINELRSCLSLFQL